MSITFWDASQAATFLGVSRMTVHRWRRAGFMPSPVYASGNITLFWTATIQAWDAAGRPWCNRAKGQCTLNAIGAEELARHIAGEAPIPPDDERQHLADGMERHLNASGKHVATGPQLFKELESTRAVLAGRN